MHEYSIVEALIDRVAREAQARGAKKVVALRVRLGELSGVDPALLATAFDTFRERSVCEGASLAIERAAASWACPRCAAPVERGAVLRCARCGVPARLVEGDELILERIEMEVPDV
jgi:hydrogenase nickel incorporation protein HypA/HybF